jgi:hypothetical protein
MDFRTIGLERVQFDAPRTTTATWRSAVRYGSEKRILFQTPPFRATVARHPFLPDATSLQKASTVDDIQDFNAFLRALQTLYEDSIRRVHDNIHSQWAPRQESSGRGPLDYLTVGSETVIYGESETLQPGDSCKVACIVACTGGWCKPESGSYGLTFEVDEIKVYELTRREQPRTFIDGKALDGHVSR